MGDVLMSLDYPRVQIQERGPDGTWSLRDARGMESTLAIPSIAIGPPLSEIYTRVEFPASEFPRRGEAG